MLFAYSAVIYRVFDWRNPLPIVCLYFLSNLTTFSLFYIFFFIILVTCQLSQTQWKPVCNNTISFHTFFVWAFKIVVDSWKFSMLLLYILWDDWTIFRISGSNEPPQQRLKYTLLKPGCHGWWISKMQSGREEERFAIKFRFELGNNARKTYGMLQTAFRPSCMNRASVFEWHKRFKEGRESVSDDERCGRSKEVNTPQLIGHFHQDNTPVHSSILVSDYLTKMGLKTVPQPPYSPDLAPWDFWLFPKLRGCRYEIIEEIKVAVTKVIDTFTLGLPEIVGTVQQVNCSRRRLLRRWLEFHVYYQ